MTKRKTASKKVIDGLIAEAHKRIKASKLEGLPIINQMIEDGKENCVEKSIVIAGQWMTKEELMMYAELCIEEGEFVAPYDPMSDAEMLECYGIRESEGENDNLYGTKGLSDEEAVIHVTKENDSWGEWIGGLVGSFPLFDKAFQERLRPVLMKTIEIAAKDGVDH